MKEIADVLNAVNAPKAEQSAARRAFLERRLEIWNDIQAGSFPDHYASAGGKKFMGATNRTAIRCDFLLASKITLGRDYDRDRIADFAQRDLLFFVQRDRETFPERTGSKFYCCLKCAAKLYECVCAKVFRYIDNEKWKSQIEPGSARKIR